MKLSILLIACQLLAVSFTHDPLQHCYDANGDSKYCIPAPVSNGRNIVAGRPPKATSTCGLEKPEQVCTRSGAVGNYTGTCKPCDSSELSAEFITDTEEAGITYWQSQTYSDVHYPNSVNLTFDLGNKAYSVEEIKIVFQSSRPESFALLASADNEDTYEPIHYFSRSCLSTYGISEGVGGSEKPGCSSDGAQLLPLTGGTVSFSATERTGSPVVATHIMIKLDRHNTFGDEHSLEQTVLDSYYYAISNVVITGRCFCNGHAASCSEDDSGQWRCDCAHGTTGPNCEMCMPLFNDLPWRPATLEQAAECKECNCNGRATQCTFDEALFNQSGSVSGGVCECLFNTSGNNCEVCTDGQDPPCSPCGCSGREIENAVCDQTSGKCVCIDGFGGSSCDVCLSTHYRNEDQCIPCSCHPDGSLTVTCSDVTGQCSCKDGVTSRDCSVCALGSHRVGEGCPACPACYDDLLVEYQSAVSLLEELNRTIATSLNGSMVDNSLLEDIADLNMRLQELAFQVSDLSEREMNLTTNVQNVSSYVAASETLINALHSQIVKYENTSSLAKEQVTNSRSAASHASEVVEEIDIKLTQYALGNLTAARELFSQIEEQLAILVDTANESKEVSLDQEQTVGQILQETANALNDSIRAHSEMCSVLKEENETLSDLNFLAKNNVKDLDLLHGETEAELSQAVTSATASLSESERLEREVEDLSVPDYDPDALITQANLLHSSASSVVVESMALLTSIEMYHQDFTVLNSTAHQLLELATTLNDTAMDLSTRAHAARALGKTSVSDAEKVINQTEYLLLELNKQLSKLKQLALELDKLKEMIQQAEDVSSKAESEAILQKELLVNASQTASHAMEILLNAAINIQFAAENATLALNHAETSASNVQTLQTVIGQLSADTDKASENVTALEERAERDSKAIGEAKVVAGDAESNLTATEAYIDAVKTELDKLSEELNSLELIPQDRFDAIMMRLENIDDIFTETDTALEKAQQNMDQVEDGFATLQEEYTTLLQHRDLLRDILENVKRLDCVEMTAAFN